MADMIQIITLCSGKGGVGKTFLAVNLAIALSKKNKDVVLIDGDLQFGDVGMAMDLQPTLTMKDLLDEQDRLDSHNITNYLVEHKSGVYVLSAPERPEYAELIDGEFIKNTLNLLKERFDYIVIDGGHGIDDSAIDFMDVADQILAVTTPEVASLKNTKRLIETIHQLQMNEKLDVLLNRHGLDSLIKAEEIPGMLRADKLHDIPNNNKVAMQSLNLGDPAVISHSKSDLAKKIFKLAQSIVDDQVESKPSKKKHSLISRMFF
ncbi:AAA family ATPase [Piscibacillus salipiscarius]|uniref:CpaE family protein n=1 Tax=Piscibacillus salipiscarius TaxID=299480 RepID=A0ABW5Q9J5_9BACI|nr:AAA family ATPase [Piscibacillus salipiscarius]